MNIEVTTVQDLTVVKVSGRLDATTAPEFEKRMAEKIAGGSRKVALDLSVLEYISSAGLRGILGTTKRLKAENGKLVLCGPTGVVQEVITLSGFGSFLPICKTVEDAARL